MAQEDQDDLENLAAVRLRLQAKQASNSPTCHLDSPSRFRTARPSSRVLPSQDPHRWSDTQASSIMSGRQSLSSQTSSRKDDGAALTVALQKLADRVSAFEKVHHSGIGQRESEALFSEMGSSKSSGCLLRKAPASNTLRHRRGHSQPNDSDMQNWLFDTSSKHAQAMKVDAITAVATQATFGAIITVPATPTAACRTVTLNQVHSNNSLNASWISASASQDPVTPQASPRRKWDVDTSRSLRKPLPLRNGCTEAFRFPAIASAAQISPCASLSTCSDSASLRPLMSFSMRASWCNEMKAFKSPRAGQRTTVVSGQYSVSLLASSPSENSCFGEVHDQDVADGRLSTPTKVQTQACHSEAIFEQPSFAVQQGSGSPEYQRLFHGDIPSYSSLPAFRRVAKTKEIRRSLQFWPNSQSTTALQPQQLFRSTQPLPSIPETIAPPTPGLCDSSDGSSDSLDSAPFTTTTPPTPPGISAPLLTPSPSGVAISVSSSVYTIIAKSPSSFLSDGELPVSFSYSKFIAEVDQRNRELRFGSVSSWDNRVGKEERDIQGVKAIVSVAGEKPDEWADVFSLAGYA